MRTESGGRVRNNAISGIAPLAGLEALTSLNLPYNDIADVTPLAELRSLTWLGLWSNAISDIAPLAGLISLRELYLTRNGISDIAPLVANNGLGSGDTLNLEGNLLSARSLDDYVPALQARGVEVTFDAPETPGRRRSSRRHPGPCNAYRL